MSTQPFAGEEFLASLPKPSKTPLTVAEYAEAKGLPEDYLCKAWGLTNGADGIVIPYHNPDGTVFRDKIRKALDHSVKPLMIWRGQRGLGTMPYGLHLVPSGTKNLCLVEGESDTQTLHYRHQNNPAKLGVIGISGADGANPEFAKLQAFIDAETIAVFREPGQSGVDFIAALAKWPQPIREKLKVVELPAGVKDISELHLKYPTGDTFHGILIAAWKESVPIPPLAETEAAIIPNAEKANRYAAMVEQALKDAFIAHYPRVAKDGGYMWALKYCPFNVTHQGGTSVAVFVMADGVLGFECKHTGCGNHHWKQLRAKIEELLGRKLVFEEPTKVDPPHPAKIAEAEPEIPEPEEEPLPEFPAITGSIAELADALCPDIPREFKIMSAVTRIGLAISGQVHLEGEQHLQPRFYTCLIAEPGRGKTAAIKETRRLSFEYSEVPSVDSAPALVDSFAEIFKEGCAEWEFPRRILLSPDEAVDLFEKAKTSPNGRNSLFAELLKLYEDNVTGNRARRNEDGPVEVNNAHLAILGGATPSGYDGMWLGSHGASGGLQSRFVSITTAAPPIPAKQRASDTLRVDAAVARIRRQIDKSSPTLLTMTPEAEEAFGKWWDSVARLDRPATTRAEDMAKRFLMVLAVTNDTDTIGADLMRMGIAFAEYVIAVRERFNPADASTYENAFEKRIQKTLERATVPLTRDAIRKRVTPGRYPGGYQSFLSAFNTLLNSSALKPDGRTERAIKYRWEG